MLPNADRPYTRRSAGKQQVANLQGHETADISNDVIHFEKHIRRIPTLHFFTVYIEMEIQLLPPDIATAIQPILNSIPSICKIAYHILLIILLHFPNVSLFLHESFMNFTLLPNFLIFSIF